MFSAFILQMVLAAFRVRVLLPLYPVFRETYCCDYICVNELTKINSGAGFGNRHLVKKVRTFQFPSLSTGRPFRDVLPQRNRGNFETHAGARITVQKISGTIKAQKIDSGVVSRHLNYTGRAVELVRNDSRGTPQLSLLIF